MVVPLDIAFGHEIFQNHHTEEMINYTIKFVYIIDLLMSFRKAIFNKEIGVEIRDPKIIAK